MKLDLYHIIDNALKMFLKKPSESLVSVTKMIENPFHAYYEENNILKAVASKEFLSKRTQDHPTPFRLNGALYISTLGSLKKNKGFLSKNMLKFELPRERSLDIDELEDFKLAESLIQLHQKN